MPNCPFTFIFYSPSYKNMTIQPAKPHLNKNALFCYSDECCQFKYYGALMFDQKYQMSQQEEKLFFYSQDPDAAEKALGKAKPIHPYSLLSTDQQPTFKGEEPPDPKQGKFVNDHLLTGETPKKTGKKISKTNKKLFYKTKMCPYGLECKKRLMACPYAHSEQERRKPFKNRKVQCKLYQLGKCHLGAACNDYHGNMDLKKKNYQYKKSVCQDFLQGKCTKGFKICIYVHPGEEVVEGFQQQNFFQQPIEPQKEQQVVVQTKKEELKVEPEEKENRIKNEIVEVLQSKIGEEQLVLDGLMFTFPANPM